MNNQLFKIRLWVEAMGVPEFGGTEIHIPLHKDFTLPFIPYIGLVLDFSEDFRSDYEEREFDKISSVSSVVLKTMYTIESVIYTVDRTISNQYEFLLQSTLWYDTEHELNDAVKLLKLGYQFMIVHEQI